MIDVYGLLITKGDPQAFHDWCRDQLSLYKGVVCLDGSDDDAIERLARPFADRLIYLHERHVEIPSKSDHGLRRVVHKELVRRFGTNIWVMCCHTDEFCYHDPRKIAARCERDGYDAASWFALHFFPHPSELPDLERRLKQPVQDRFQHYYWDYLGSGQPFIEDRLYKARPHVHWDAVTHSSIRPHGVARPAPFHPVYRHFKVLDVDPARFESVNGQAVYRGRWEEQQFRSGLPQRVERMEDMFVASVPRYSRCDRFEGVLVHDWNIGESYRPDGVVATSAANSAVPMMVAASRPGPEGIFKAEVHS